MRLIDADYLKTWFGEKDLYTYDYIIGTIDDAPTVKAEPERKKGKWLHDNPNTFSCSKCNKSLDIGCGNMKMNFCPNCDADMREGEQE